jgi:hypothetical protein
MSIYELPTDVLLTIARMEAAAWIKLVSNYPRDAPNEFIKYSYSKQGIDEIAKLATDIIITDVFTAITVLGRFHSIYDEPALSDNGYFTGGLSWYYDGKLHRDNGPAMKTNYGTYYYKHGELHRLDGPAIKTTLNEEYWIDGREYSMPMPKSWRDVYCK